MKKLLKITFLGTAGSIPTPERNPSAILVNTQHEMLMLDCGEGAQQQMMRVKSGLGKLSSIFITHFHADHILGLPGLIQTLSFSGRTEPLHIYGPEGMHRFKQMFTLMGFYRPRFEVYTHELAPHNEVRLRGYTMRTFRTRHSIPSIGYVLDEDERRGRFDRHKAEHVLGIPPGPLYSHLHNGESIEWGGMTINPSDVVGAPRKGRKIVYTGDTCPCEGIYEAAADADVLIHDSTFGSEHAELAKKVMHSTAREAAEVAKRVNAKRLILTHISARYSESVQPLLDEAREVFANSDVAFDLSEFDVPYPE